MHDAKTNFSACVFQNKILLIGGDTNGEVLDTVEEFDPETQIFSLKQRLQGKRCQHTVCVWKDKVVFVFGGSNFAFPINVHLFTECSENLETKWTPLSYLPENLETSNYLTSSMNGDDLIYICNGEQFYSFDPRTYQYTQLPSPRYQDRYWVTSVVAVKPKIP